MVGRHESPILRDALALAPAILAVYFLVFWYAVGDLGLAFACTGVFTFVLARYSLAVMALFIGASISA